MENKVGRPAIFSTVEELQQVVDTYFESRKPEALKDADGKVLTNSRGLPIIKLNPPTLTGLALALGFNSRGTLYEYEKKPEFSDTIKAARLRCENWVETELLSNSIQPASGIFILKNYGWKDNFGITNPEGGDLFEKYLENLRGQ